MAVLIETGKIGVVINCIRTFCPEYEPKIIDIVEDGGVDRDVVERINTLLEEVAQIMQDQSKKQAKSVGA
ncbi:MAG: hypothetical protein IKZ87_00845 [Actinomycetaceae bacterium]|nr:hypothetical protein [Actinomycetaceae bacterium]